MAIAEITIWLNGQRDYNKGVALLKKHSTNKFLIKVLEASETEYNFEMLLRELTGMNAATEPPPPQKEPQPAKEILSEAEYKRAPVTVQQLKQQATELHKQSARLHSIIATHLKEAMRLYAPLKFSNWTAYYEKIDAYLKERSVAVLVHELLDADDEKDKLFYKIDYWKLHGQLPEEIAENKASTNDKFFLRQTLTNLRSQISKRKKKLMQKAGLTNGDTANAINACLEADTTYMAWLRERDDLERRIDELI